MPIRSPSSVLLRTQTDERLVVLARAGHERAFEAIVERYRGALLRASRRYLPEARAEDALQQAFIAAWSALQRGDEVRDLRAWLYRIVHNTRSTNCGWAGTTTRSSTTRCAGARRPRRRWSGARSCARRSPGWPRCRIVSAR